jgi:hypothetical protein
MNVYTQSKPLRIDMDQKALLFSDWNLDAIVANMNAERDDDFSTLVKLTHDGKISEAAEWIKVETSHYPWVLMVAAYVNLQENKVDEARRLLRAVTLISKDSLVQLWAWHNLTALGKPPSASMAQNILGIIIEVPYENGVEVLASYLDGTARYINHRGGMILWEDYDETITPLIYEGFKMAHVMGSLSNVRKETPVADGDVRLTLLTPGGLHIWEGSPEDGSDVSRLFAQQANLLRALVRLALDNQKGQG